MINIVNNTLQQAKKDFENYLIEINKENLLYRVDEIFNYSLKKTVDEFTLILRHNNKQIFNKNIKIENLTDLHSILKTVNIPTDNIEIALKLNDNFIYENSLKGDIIAFFEHNIIDIFNIIGFVDVQLIHNKTKELVSLKLNINKLLTLNEELNNNKDVIIDKYFKKTSKKDKIKFYGDGGEIFEMLTGNFIVDEFGRYICDEFGNFLTFE
jgi:hypothetical protein